MKGNTKIILAVVFTLAIICASLVPAVTVSAATQDWPLQLVGATTIDMTQAQFEALAIAHPSNTYVDSSGNTWQGVAMWRLIALVDDGDPATFSSALVGTYSIKLTGSDGFNKTVAPPYTGFAFASPTEDLFVANKVMLNGTTEWISLPMTKPGDPTKLWYPLIDTGSGITVGNLRVSSLVKIELLTLPVSSVSVSPSSQAVANGATFTVNLNVNTNQECRGWQANVNFDASKLTANSVSEGAFLSAYAIPLGGGTVSGGAVTINNTAGTITIPGYAITGAGSDGPTGTGTLCTISFTAKTGIDNYASISLSGVVVSNQTGVTIPGTTVTGGTVAIGNVPMADLVVSAASTTKVSDSLYTITYTITNQGNAAAGASTTSIVIDSGTPITVACPALAAGASDTQTTANQTLSSGSDTITVTADSAGVVAESNEGNNARTITYALAGGNGNTSINGNIAANLVLIVPASIDPWNLIVGTNDIAGSANVKCNTNWQLQVNDQDSTNTSGHMTKWMLGVYVPATKLIDPLHVDSSINVALSGTPQTIISGTPAGQNGDSGQTIPVYFHQRVYFADPVLTGGYSYHIVVTFTASVTF